MNVFVLIGLLELPWLMWTWVGPLIQPKRYSNHQDQVAAALRRHGYTVNAVYLDQGWPDRINSQTYGTNLAIHLSGGFGFTSVSGRLECRVQKRNCWYQVATLGISREELTDLLPMKPQPTWQDRLISCVKASPIWIASIPSMIASRPARNAMLTRFDSYCAFP